MRFASIWTLASCVTAGSTTSLSGVKISRCGNTLEPEDLRSMAHNMSVRENAQFSQVREVTAIVVPTIAHVVYANMSEQGGYIPVSIVSKSE